MGEFIAVNEDEESQPEATWLQPRRVRIGRGWGWIYGGFGLFNRGMGVSVGICLFSLVLSIAAGLVPGGSLLYQLFDMVFIAGMLAVADRAHSAGYVSFNDYFEGFRQQMGPLVLTAVIYMALIFGVVFLVMLAAMASIGLDSLLHFDEVMEADPTSGLQILLWVLIAMALIIPVMMAAMFAPALVFFHQVAPWQAMTLSFYACLRNFWVLSWWGILATLMVLFGFLMMFIGLLVVLPVMWYSSYLAYRDIFLYDEV